MRNWKAEVMGRLASLGIEPTRESEIIEELAQHLEDRYEELCACGAAEEDAYRAALVELSDCPVLVRELRQVERGVRDNPVALGEGRKSMIRDLWQDIRYGVRVLAKSPGFTVVAVLTMALGIGANTAMFSVVYAVLLRPLPYADSDRLVILAEKSRDGDRMGAAYPNYKDWSERAQSFDEMAAYQGSSFNLTGVDRPVRLQGRRVNWNFFRLLGASPQLGRSFTDQDDSPGATPTAIISHGLWKEQFGGAPDIIDSTIKVDQIQYTIIGVLPPDFEYIRRDDLYVPLGLSLAQKTGGLLDRGNHFSLFALARLKEGVPVAQANEEMKALAAQLEQEYPATNSGNSATAQSLIDVFVENVRPTLIILLAAVGFVLLIACVNVANLTLVRSAERQKEIAVRLALGAGRGRIVRQFLSESVLIALAGGAAGLLIGAWAVSGLMALVPPNVPRLGQVKMNETVFIFTLGVSLLTGLLFGLLPALQASGTSLQGALKEGGRSTGGSLRERTRKILLVAEVGLALVLLIGAGLMLRTVSRLMSVDPGFNADNLLTMRFIMAGEAYTQDRRRNFYNECIQQVEALPGVESAALTMSLPIDGSEWQSIFIAADKPVPERAELPSASFVPISSNFFETLGIRLLKGRVFSEADVSGSPHVVVINESLAKRIWPDEDPIGKRLKQGWPEDKTPWREVVGVVSDVKLNGVNRETPIQAYLPLTQEPARFVALIARTRGNPLAFGTTVEQTIRSLDKELPVYNTRSMDQLMGNSVGLQRLTMVLLSGFAVLALLLAAVGIYGVMSYTVTQRTHEIGIRMAMGARPRDVLMLIVGQGMVLTVIGISIGLAAAFGLARLMSSLLSDLLFGVSASDPLSYAMLTAVLSAVALLACYLPARRATRVDPMVALRYE
ncbi:MAG TPA: ABC transporter permease [Blastocatellia bacterium]|nr:ABC transporter permease [Blastocatellia bacterium]